MNIEIYKSYIDLGVSLHTLQCEKWWPRDRSANSTGRTREEDLRGKVSSSPCWTSPWISSTVTRLLWSPAYCEPSFPRSSPSAEHTPLFSLNNENMEDDFMAWTSEEDFSLSSAISAILKDLDTVIDASQGPCASQRAPLSSVENLTQYQSGLRTERMSDMASSIKTEAMCPGCPQDVALDKLLLDIDTSVFEPEVNLLQGFSVTADDLAKYLPSLSKSASASSSSSLVSHGQATWEIQEIEHVMDILMRTYPQS
ncbi:hypothetical protein Q8A67_012220 [Cirrhinus molitorella]|uniref:SERTA domain-containing protein n=1 Tax=Cirrhinus molitorella TaxID=172907 RepID=A0AA88PXN5_9TELE|nr:hypothetical protein Q8A67_012220 [Cirrhinus molitorella]